MNAAAQSGHNTDSLDAHHSQESLEADSVEIPEVDFKYLQLNQCSSYYQSMLRSVPTGNLMRQRQCFFQPNNMYNLIASPCMPNRKRCREPETDLPFMGGYATNEQSAQLWNYPFVDSTPEQFNGLPDSHLIGNATYSSPSGPPAEELELPSFQCFDPQEEPGYWGTQHFNLMPALESDNTLVHSPLTDQTPSDCPSSFCDGLLESVIYGSSGERRATDTDSDSPLLQPALLGHMELAPASANTTGNKLYSLGIITVTLIVCVFLFSEQRSPFSICRTQLQF